MKKQLFPALIALTFAAAALSSHAANEPGRSGDPASPEKSATPKKKVQTHGSHKAAGREGAPASVHKKDGPGGPELKNAGATTEPGRSGDPASPEKKM
jgi:hypothetical protein